jgi:hypothetical protein
MKILLFINLFFSFSIFAQSTEELVEVNNAFYTSGAVKEIQVESKVPGTSTVWSFRPVYEEV